MAVVAVGNDKLTAALKSSCEKLIKQIQPRLSAIPTDAERGEAMRHVRDQLRTQFPAYNVMIVHPQHQKDFQECAHCKVELKRSHFAGSIQVYIFKRGRFTLLGDGGFINWCFGGNWERNDKSVTFRDIPRN